MVRQISLLVKVVHFLHSAQGGDMATLIPCGSLCLYLKVNVILPPDVFWSYDGGHFSFPSTSSNRMNAISESRYSVMKDKTNNNNLFLLV